MAQIHQVRTRYKSGIVVCLLLIGGLFPVTVVQLQAQSDTGSLRVEVVDSTGAAVVGATVKVINEATGITAAKNTVADGFATFDPLQRGIYDVEAQMAGFKGIKNTGVSVDVNGRRFLSIKLAVAPVSQAIDVVEVTPPLQTEQASLGQVISGDVAVQLPSQELRGRSA